MLNIRFWAGKNHLSTGAEMQEQKDGNDLSLQLAAM